MKVLTKALPIKQLELFVDAFLACNDASMTGGAKMGCIFVTQGHYVTSYDMDRLRDSLVYMGYTVYLTTMAHSASCIDWHMIYTFE